jgi:3-deoxy-D-manno-octulosonic-acid transferase
MLRYRLLLALLSPAVWLWLWLRGRNETGYRQRWGERLGLVRVTSGADYWIHGASLGELVAAKPLIDSLLSRDQRLLITAVTPAGSGYVQQQYGERVQHCYLPIDWPGAVKRFLKKAQPQRLVVLETELWPNLLAACHQRGIDVSYASARLTDNSVAGYQRFMSAKLLTRVLAPVRVIATQTEADKKRFESLGAPADKVVVTGNIKFDLALPAGFEEKRQSLAQEFEGRTVLLAASTHEGEEAAIAESAKILREQIPNLLLVIAPRHQNRFDAVAESLKQAGFSVARRSQGMSCDAKVEIYLADTLGELLNFYAVAEVAFVGGSLVPVGGHNVLEPALTETAVVVGPHLHEQPIAETLVEDGALLQAADEHALTVQCLTLLTSDKQRQRLVKKASRFLAANRGALKRSLDLIG